MTRMGTQESTIQHRLCRGQLLSRESGWAAGSLAMPAFSSAAPFLPSRALHLWLARLLEVSPWRMNLAGGLLPPEQFRPWRS